MRFQGETTVDLQHPSQHQQQLEPHQMRTAASATTPSSSSNGVLLNATQKDLESKYFFHGVWDDNYLSGV